MNAEGTCLYLYGFVALPLAPVVRANAHAQHGVELVELDEIACAVTAVRSADYVRPPDAATEAEQLEWVTPRARRHHDVLRLLHSAAAVVPLKFGTLCPDAPQVRGLLQDLHAPIAAALARFRGKDEWTLKIAADARACGERLRTNDSTLTALENDARDLPVGRAYFARKKLERLAAELLDRELACIENAVYQRIAGACGDIGDADHPQVEPASTAAVIARTPVLVVRERLRDLESVLADLEDEHAPLALRFELVGPWPPYSFTPALSVGEFEAV